MTDCSGFNAAKILPLKSGFWWDIKKSSTRSKKRQEMGEILNKIALIHKNTGSDFMIVAINAILKVAYIT